MQPLRKDHVDHYKEFVRDEFSIASNRVEREISQQAQDKVEEVGDKFASVIHKNLPNLIKDMAKNNIIEAKPNTIVSGTTIKGEVDSSGDFRIDGTLIGSINCKGKIASTIFSFIYG